MANSDIPNVFFSDKVDTVLSKPLITPKTTGRDADKIDQLRSKHELYEKFSPEWEFYLDSYEGGKEFMTPANIFKHVRENYEDYNDRIQRAVYHNYVQPVISFFSNFIYCETISRNGGSYDAQFQKFLRDVNRRGDSIDVYMREVSEYMQIFGHLDILVDKKRYPEGETVQSLQDEMTLGLDMPYYVTLWPLEILDWTFSEEGGFTYVKRMVKKNDKEVYTEWFPDRTAITIIDMAGKSPKIVESKVIPNLIGVVPIYRSFFKRSKKYRDIGSSFITDISYINRRILNITSLTEEFLARQCFNLLAKETDMSIPFRDQNEGSIGTSNILEVPRGAQFPKYVSPPVDPAAFLQSEREKSVLEIYRIAAQDTASEIWAGQAKSGESQYQSFAKTVPHIATRAENLEQTETQLAQLWLRYIDPTAQWDGTIAYKDDYSEMNLTSFLLQLKMLMADVGIPSPSFWKEELTRAAKLFDGKIPSDVFKEVMKDINNNVTEQYIQNKSNQKVGTNNLKGVVPNIQQQTQGAIQEVVGNNKEISALGADNVQL